MDETGQFFCAPAASSRPILSIIVPAYNEKATVGVLLSQLRKLPQNQSSYEIIVIDDGSTDGTGEILSNLRDVLGIKVISHSRNCGKGAAIRSGLKYATGDVTVIQDADLEYDPFELFRMIEPILKNEVDVVYGSRYLNSRNYLPWTRYRIAVHGMNAIVRILYGFKVTDVNTCYKAIRTQLYRELDLKCRRFEYCAEVTAKLCRLGITIKEIPISYHPRSRTQGKKIGWKDALQFAVALFRWRIVKFETVSPSSSCSPSESGAPQKLVIKT